MPRDTVQRKIYFYRPQLPLEAPGAIFDPRAACALIEQLAFDSGERYSTCQDDENVCVWVERSTWPVRLRIGRIRYAGLPNIEDSGQILPLEIEEDQGLLEQTHVVWFRNGILGAEFNFYGPRLSRLAHYLNEKCPTLPRVTFDMLLNQEATEQVAHLGDVRLLQLRLRRDYVSLLQSADESLPAALRSTSESVNAPIVEITFRQEPHSRQGLGRRALDIVRNLAGDPRTREGADRFFVRGLDTRTNHVDAFDLLKDMLVTTARVTALEDRHRGVDSEAMFRAIEEAYYKLADSLQRAAGIGA